MEAAADSSLADPSAPAPALFDVRFALLSAAAMLAVCLCLWLAGWWSGGWIGAWPRFQDDAYYYLTIARNVAAGHGFTMDQLSPTNGFQPLWLWLLVPVAWLCGGDVWLFLSAAQGIVVVLTAASIGVLCGLVRARLGLEPAILAGLLLLLPRFLNVALSGMESALVLLVESVLVLETIRSRVLSRPEPSARDAWTGLWLGLLVLSRLDTVFVAFAFALHLALYGLWRGAGGPLQRIARVAAKGLAVFWPTLLLVTPYLAWNVLAFGSAVPVSGVLKTSFPLAGWSPEHLRVEYLGLLALAFAGAALELNIARRASELVRVLAVLSFGLALHAAYTVVYMRWAIFAWHFATFIPAGMIGAALLAHGVSTRVSVGVLRLLLLLVLAFQMLAQTLSISRLGRSFTVASREAGLWAAHALPPDAVLGMKDSGTFSYFAQRRVMNLDGVANSFAYQRALCAGELERFLHEHGVQYLVQHSVPPFVRIGAYGTFQMVFPCHLPGGGAGELDLRRDLEVFRGAPYANDAGRLDQLFVWRLPP